MATAQERAEKRAKQKAAKQKKLLLVLVPVLIGLLAFQGPKVLKQLKGSEAAAPAPATTAAATSADATAPATPVPSAGATPEAVPVDVKQALPSNTDVPISAGEGQLISFSRFQARDPFVALVDDSVTTAPVDTTGSSTGSTGGSGTTGTGSTGTGGSTTPPPTTTPSTTTDGGTTATSVTLSINGKTEVHIVGDTFPAADPAFRVISISTDAVVIGLADGTFDGGGQTLSIKRGESVTLVSQPDGARFTIKVVAIG